MRLSVLTLEGLRTHLQRQVDLTTGCVDGAIHGIRGVKVRRGDEQNAGPRAAISWIGDGDLEALINRVEGGVFDVTRTGGSIPPERSDHEEPDNEHHGPKS